MIAKQRLLISRVQTKDTLKRKGGQIVYKIKLVSELAGASDVTTATVPAALNF